MAAHRGKTVDDLIQESVESYLSKQSFGSCADVEEILRQMGLETKPFKYFYPYLDGMMKRRHRIVHEGDLPSPQDTSTPPWTFVDLFQLSLWNLAVLAFYALLRVSLDPTDELQRWYFERRTKAIELFRQSPAEITLLPDQYVDAKSMMIGFQRRVEEVMQQVIAQLRQPSQEELLVLAERIVNKAE